MTYKLFTIILGFMLTSSMLFAKKEVLVDLSVQKAYAMEDGYIVFEGRISSGKEGRETPTGVYKIMQKKRIHVSNLWPKPKGGAKMPYMLRLTNSGIAMHLGYVPDRAASHGCIRLENGFAQKMFRWARVDTIVYVEGDARDYMDYITYQNRKSNDEYDYDDNYYDVVDYHY